ncbi:MAG: hypothetical protein PHH22_03955 [Clostridia bacterium]|nr:hypothetical protein [Clostridia bacterium]
MTEKFLCEEEDNVHDVNDIVSLILKCTDSIFYESDFFNKLNYDKVNLLKKIMYDDIVKCLLTYGQQYITPYSVKKEVTLQVLFIVFDDNHEYLKSLNKFRNKSIGEILNEYRLDDDFLKHVLCNYIITKPKIFTKVQYLCILMKV